MKTNSRRGSALLLATICIVIVAGMASAFLIISTTQNRTTFNASVSDICLHMAEAGIDDTINKMNGYGAASEGNSTVSSADYMCMSTVITDSVGTKNVNSGTVDRGTYTVEVRPAYSGRQTYTVRATGVQGDRKRGIEVVVQDTLTSTAGFGGFGKDRLHLDSVAKVDSYKSTLGSYASQVTGSGAAAHARTSGNVGSNSSISLDSNAKVWGNATPGPSGNVTTGSNSTITGSTAPAPAPQPFPPITVPSLPSSGSVNLGSNSDGGTITGDHHYTSFQMNSNSTLTIRGPARIVADSLITDSNTVLTLDTSGGPIEIYGTGTFNVNSNSDFGTGNTEPGKVKLYLTSTGTVSVDSNASLHADVYAPNATMLLDSNGQLFGRVRAKELELNSNFSLHFDEDLGGAVAPPKYKIKSWREFNP